MIGAAVMVAHQGSLNIAVKPEMIKAIEAKHSDSMMQEMQEAGDWMKSELNHRRMNRDKPAETDNK